MTAIKLKELISDKKFQAALKLLESDQTPLLQLSSRQYAQFFRQINKTGQLGRCKELGEYYLATNPNDADANFLMGNCEIRMGNHKSALTYLTRAFENDPNAIITQVNLALVYNKLGDNEKAIGMLKKVLEQKPDYSFVHDKLGYYLCRMGCVKEGIRSFQRALQCSDKKQEAYSRLLFWRNYLEETSAQSIYDEARFWGTQLKLEYTKGNWYFS